jgi:hypothetical protein
MLDVSAIHPFEARAEFALRFRRHLAEGDLAAAEALIDVNATGGVFAESFLATVAGRAGSVTPTRIGCQTGRYTCGGMTG